ERHDDERCHQKPEQGQPPWALVRCLLLAQHACKDLQRREDFRLRPWRREPEKPPDHREGKQAPQDGRKSEAEGQPAHQRVPVAMPPSEPSAMWTRTRASE